MVSGGKFYLLGIFNFLLYYLKIISINKFNLISKYFLFTFDITKAQILSKFNKILKMCKIFWSFRVDFHHIAYIDKPFYHSI